MKTITLNKKQIELLLSDNERRLQTINNTEYWLHEEQETRNQILNKLKN